MTITGGTKLAGVMGWPIRQSLSPRLHGYWLRALGIDGAFVPLPVAPQDFTAVLGGLRRAGFAGVNVTVPHKEAAFAIAHEADAAATAAGAANLLLFDEGRILARNTDTPGLENALRDGLGSSLAGKDAVLLGAGGAARGAVLALAQLGIARLHILNRNAGRAQSLAKQMQLLTGMVLTGGGLEDITSAAPQTALLVNATAAGMNGAAPLALDLAAMPKDAAVFDMVYKPLETALLAQARARGLKTMDGLGMLMHQAVPSFEGFYGVRPTVTAALRAHLEQAL